MSIPKLLEDLLIAAGPSGYEEVPATVWRQAAKQFADEVKGDLLGSSIARVQGTQNGPLLLLVGHIDEIGLMINHIDDDGYIYCLSVGGWDSQILVGQRVTVITDKGAVPGVIGKKPIHLLTSEEQKKVTELQDLHIDIGAKDGEQAKEMVSVGDVAVLAGEPQLFPNRRVVSRALDNRVGAYVVLEAARLISSERGSPGDVAAIAGAQEEITFGGAVTTAFALEPELAIVVDVTFETKAPGVDPKQTGKHEYGSGPVIGRGSVLNEKLFNLICDTARQENIPFTVSASTARTSTDADAIHRSRAGVPTGVISVPLRYMHSPVEMVSLDDIEAATKLIAAVAQRLTPGMSFVR